MINELLIKSIGLRNTRSLCKKYYQQCNMLYVKIPFRLRTIEGYIGAMIINNSQNAEYLHLFNFLVIKWLAHLNVIKLIIILEETGINMNISILSHNGQTFNSNTFIGTDDVGGGNTVNQAFLILAKRVTNEYNRLGLNEKVLNIPEITQVLSVRDVINLPIIGNNITHITLKDCGIKYLPPMPNLKYLNLARENMDEIDEYPQLEHLDIHSSKVEKINYYPNLQILIIADINNLNGNTPTKIEIKKYIS